jgi:hypothetical protein
MSSSIPSLHAEFLERVRSEIARDTRFNALLAGGSYIHGGFDRHSDLDLVLVVEDDHYHEVMSSRQAFAQRIGDLLAAFTGEHVGEPRLLICLYGPSLIHVDLKFVTQAGLERLIERPAVIFARDPGRTETLLAAAAIAWPNLAPEWFEQRAWIWLHYGATKLARGELFEAIGILAFFREQVLGPMLHRRAGRPQRGVRRLEMTDGRASELLAQTMAAHDGASIRAALLAATTLYLDLRNDMPPSEVVSQMPQALLSYLKLAAGDS